MFQRQRRNRYKFTEKTHSKKGIATLVIAALLIAIYIIFVLTAYYEPNGLSAYHGSIGVFAIFVSIVAIVLSIQSMQEEDSFQLFPRISLVASILAAVSWIGTYVMGFMA